MFLLCPVVLSRPASLVRPTLGFGCLDQGFVRPGLGPLQTTRTGDTVLFFLQGVVTESANLRPDRHLQGAARGPGSLSQHGAGVDQAAHACYYGRARDRLAACVEARAPAALARLEPGVFAHCLAGGLAPRRVRARACGARRQGTHRRLDCGGSTRPWTRL